VRRGDYLNNKDHHPVLPISYYQKAIGAFSDAQFVVFSDDISWCKSHFDFSDTLLFIEDNDEVTDLYLMSLMKHHIIANSSFSWWGAWLCQNPDKVVIAPQLWFGPAAVDHDTKDLIPEVWNVI